MENINRLTEEIAQTAFDNIPDENWISGVVNISMLTTYNETTGEYFTSQNEKGISFDPNYPDAPKDKIIDRLFIKLREEMYAQAPGKGAWYNARLTVTEDGDFEITYDYDNKPNFEMIPDDEEYRIDTKEFPRDEASTPDWLSKVING